MHHTTPMRGRPRRWTLLVIAVAITVLAGATSAGAGPAGSGAAEGMISGTVTDPEGAPVADVMVGIEGTGAWAVAFTAEDGTYELFARPGSYAVHFTPPEGSPLATQYYDQTYHSPTPVTVTADQTTSGIDAQLAVGATVSGTVVDGDGAAVNNADVVAWSWWGGWPNSVWTSTGSDGTYELVGVPPGYAVVRVFPPFGRPDLASEYYLNAFNLDQATPIALALGGTTPGIDFELGPPGSISGTVTDPEGAPVADAWVTIEETECCGGITTFTASDGTYSMEVAPGTYTARFEPPNGRPWMVEWYDDIHSFEVAPTSIDVAEGQTVTGIDAQFDRGAAVAGRVTGLDGRGLPGVSVLLTSTADPTNQHWAWTSGAGVWSAPAIPAGSYTVEFQAGHARQWYDGQLRPQNAAVLDVTPDMATTGIDARLDAIVFGQDFVANGTRVLAACSADDVSTFTFTVDGFDPTGGVTGGTIDFGDGSPAASFSASDDTVTHTFEWDDGTSTGPAYPVTVSLTGGGEDPSTYTIVPGATGCGVESGATFSDVPTSHIFHEAIECLVDLEVTFGFEDGTFRPGQPITRAAVVSWLWRLAGEPPPDSLPEFSDVPLSHPFADAIAWAAERDITGGYPDGTFRPGLAVTRGAVAAWMHRYQFSPSASLPTGFSDVPADHPFVEPIAWLAAAGITQGYPDGTFRPGQPISRGGLASWVCTLSGLSPEW